MWSRAGQSQSAFYPPPMLQHILKKKEREGRGGRKRQRGRERERDWEGEKERGGETR